ncbi:MAG: hypothetical protein PHF48_03330, partial [Bacteroidales bacterium]|nr:hypothetical protein [Bacteroidales bacterium]
LPALSCTTIFSISSKIAVYCYTFLFAKIIPTDYFVIEKGCKDMLFPPYPPNILEEKFKVFFLAQAIC